MSKSSKSRSASRKANLRKSRTKSAVVPPEDLQSGRLETNPTKTNSTAISKTPLFVATHALRYQRQLLVKQIEAISGNRLMCFTVGEHREVERDDTLGFVDMLHNIQSGESIDLMIHTGGGDVDAAEKLIFLIHAKTSPAKFRVIVPEYAKSAGTLMVLGAATIIMSDSSELGMIDPQFPLKNVHGNEIWTSVVAYLQAYEHYSLAVNTSPDDRAAAAMFGHFDPVVVRKFQSQRDRASDIAMRMLNRHGLNASEITAALLDLDRWKSHGQMIGHADCLEIGLKNVSYLPPDDNFWKLCWQLHCLQRLEVGKAKKLYESAVVSQVFEV